MKIVYLHQYFNTPAMSGGTRSYEMARRFVAAGHEVHMVTSWRGDDRGSGWFTTEEAGIYVHWLPVPYSNYMSYAERIRAFFRFALLAARKAALLKGDLVFATSTPLTISLPAVYAARRNRVPMVFEVRDLWPELPIAMGALRNPIAKWLAKALERFSYRNSHHVVALSPGMKDGIVATGYPEGKVSIIPNSADLDLFSSDASGAAEFRQGLRHLDGRSLVVYTGTFGAINGVGYFVQMAKAAMDHRLPLYFVTVGDGAEFSKVQAQARELGVLDRYLSLLPSLPKTKIPAVLTAADVACSLFIDLKPMWANSANKFFDGLASGTPMAINYGGWQAELLTRTGSGLALPVGDPERGAQMIADLVADKSKLVEFGKAARSLAEVEFSRDKLAARLEQVLLEAVTAKD